MLATVLAPDAGDVRLLGLDPRRDDERVAIRRRLGYLPQEPGFHRHFTAFEFVDYVAILKELTDRRARHDEVRRVLAAVDLQDVANRRIRALSGGMRRRVALAQALLGDPRPAGARRADRRPRPGAAAALPRARLGRGRAPHGRASRRTRPRTSPPSARASSCCTAARVRFAGTPARARRPRARPGLARRRAAGRRDRRLAHGRRPLPRGRRASRPAPSPSSRRSRTATCCCVGARRRAPGWRHERRDGGRSRRRTRVAARRASCRRWRASRRAACCCTRSCSSASCMSALLTCR